MCMFNVEVAKVSNTKIFVGLSKDTKFQLTVYSNDVMLSSNGKKNAMVLPFPIPLSLYNKPIDESTSHLIDSHKDVIQLVNMKDYSSFFSECESYFPRYEVLSMYAGNGATSWSTDSLLEVKKLGAYAISVARRFEDLSRIDNRVFQLSKLLEPVLRRYYSTGFGFIICSFDATMQLEHPLAYVHHVVGDGSYFVPTRHEHGIPSYFSGSKTTQMAQFDHDIYVANPVQYPMKMSSMSNVTLMLPIALQAVQSFGKLSMNGLFENKDIIIPYDPKFKQSTLPKEILVEESASPKQNLNPLFKPMVNTNNDASFGIKPELLPPASDFLSPVQKAKLKRAQRKSNTPKSAALVKTEETFGPATEENILDFS